MIKLKLTQDIYESNKLIGLENENVTLIQEEVGELPFLVENSMGARYYIGRNECECVVENA